jgi:Type II secretion system (T2SS), protein F
VIAATALLLAAALIALPGPISARGRLSLVFGCPDRAPPRRSSLPPQWVPGMAAAATGLLASVLFGWLTGVLAAGGAFAGCRRWLRQERHPPPDPLMLAATWDLLAACLNAGLPVPTAIRAVAADAPEASADALRRTADLMALGADPVEAWAPAMAEPSTVALARGARRTARSGTALAGVASGLADSTRSAAADTAEARAQRAAVLITGPLGLCFLPAFLCLGVVPVVIGLASRLLITW